MVLQLLKVLNQWVESLDHDRKVDTIYMDFQKAFDKVPQSTEYGQGEMMGGEIEDWVSSFVTGRK